MNLIVHQQSKSLVIPTNDAGAFTSVLPFSKVVHLDGRTYVAIKHDLDAVQVLKNMGYSAPSPITYQYKWPGIYQPWSHQQDIASFLTLHRKGFVFVGMGGGKSASALWAMDYLMNLGVIRKALVVAPLSCLYDVWQRDAFNTVTHRRVAVLHGTKQRRLDLLKNSGAEIFVINHDGLGVVWNELSATEGLDLIVVDEVGKFRNHNTTRFKLLNRLVEKTDRRLWMLTATPCPDSPTDAWALAKLVGNPNRPKWFKQFREETMVQLTSFKWVAKSGSYEKAYEIMQPAIRIKKEDCIDLPPITTSNRLCELTDEQRQAFRAMHKNYVMDAKSGVAVTAANAAVRLGKLMQIICGAVITGDPNTPVEKLDASHRLNILTEILEECESKVIVFVPFKAALSLVEDHFNSITKGIVERIDGDVSLSKRTTIFERFRNDPSCRVLVAHPGCMAHGVNLSAASVIVWYAPIFSADIYDQANNRISRPDQKLAMSIIHLHSTKLELEVYRALLTKQKIQDKILDLYNNEISGESKR